MNWKLYTTLVIPAAIIMLVFGFLVPIPSEYFIYIMIVPALFWILYYSIDYAQKRKKNHNQNSNSSTEN
jgi:4-hydroxybenzoate polyprenyltransferase